MKITINGTRTHILSNIPAITTTNKNELRINEKQQEEE